MKDNIKIYKPLSMLWITFFSITISFGQQYVHPNQAGRKGGDTGPGIGKSVITSTYLGNAGNTAAQGVIISVSKDGLNKSSFHEFKGYPSDGSYSWYTTPHQASDGSLYGASFIGGSSNLGAVYKYNLGTGIENLIQSNTAGAGNNYANVNELSDGKIYALHTYGGANNYGALVKMNKDGSNVQVVHNFGYSLAHPNYSIAAQDQLTAGGVTGATYDGAYPYGFVVEGHDGKIYGSTYAGGAWNYGTFYRCNKDGSSYEIINVGNPNYTTYQNGRGGQIAKAWNIYNSWGNVAIDRNGKVYVTGYYGGYLNYGGVARMDPDGSNYQILHSGNLSEGTFPYRGALIVDDKVYGTYRTNGTYTTTGGKAIGTVYSMNLDGTDFKVLKGFDNSNPGYADGTDPWSGLSYDGEFLYGTTLSNGGVGSVGTIFKIRPNGNDFKTIHRFQNSSLASCTTNGVTKPGMYAYYPSSERVTFGDVNSKWSLTCVSNLTCNAGTTAPALSKTTISNECTATTADLTNIGVSNLPTNTQIEWHNATPISATNLVSTPTAVTAGTYYAVFYDSVNGCYASDGTATTAVTVTINSCPFVNYSPTITTNKLSNACPATVANLTTLEYGAAPSGATVTWHTATPVTVANQVTNPASVPAGTYYAAYYDGTSFGPASNPVTVTAIACTGITTGTICPGLTGNLMTVSTSTTAPANTTLTWHTGVPATVVNQVADATKVPTGTYYPAYYDAVNNCYGMTGAPVTVTQTSCYVGTMDCSKTTLSPAPVSGISSIIDMVIAINVTTPGVFGPITLSGSGLSLANGINSVTATTTGLQTFHLLVNYDGSPLSTLNFTVGSASNAGSCIANLGTVAPKQVVSNIWSLDNCTPVQLGPGLK